MDAIMEALRGRHGDAAFSVHFEGEAGKKLVRYGLSFEPIREGGQRVRYAQVVTEAQAAGMEPEEMLRRLEHGIAKARKGA